VLNPESTSRAYLLLVTLSLVLSEGSEHQEQMRDLELIRNLFGCAVGAGSNSIVATQAFRLLDAIVFRSDENPSIADRPDVQEIIDEFAEQFSFTPEPTPQMVAAFRLFAGHRYTDYQHPDVVFVLPARDVCQAPPGVTPLEMYAHLLLDEPTQSDRLCQLMLERLRELAVPGNRLRDPENDPSPDYSRKLIEADWPLMNFLRTLIRNPFARQRQEAVCLVLEEVFPSAPDAIFGDERKLPHNPGKSRRVNLNGAIQKFAEFLAETRIGHRKEEVMPIEMHPVVKLHPKGLDAVLRMRREIEKEWNRMENVKRPMSDPLRTSVDELPVPPVEEPPAPP
jgi:hypothetical protein